MTDKIITEPAQDMKVLTEAEVVVVGGGPGGHSAAIAAAMAVKDGIQPRQVDCRKLQEKLLDQDVPLPGVELVGVKS